MSHSKEEEETESVRTFLDGVDMLYNNIKTIDIQLQNAIKESSRSKITKYLELVKTELKEMNKRISFIQKELK